MSAYINLNDKVHDFSDDSQTVSLTSWADYFSGRNEKNFCPIKISKTVILDQFNSEEEYKEFALEALSDIKENKLQEKEDEKELEEDFL